MVVAVLLGLGWVLTGIGSAEGTTLADRIAVYRTAKLIELISGVPGLEHLERPDYLAQVEQINAGRRQLAAAPRQLLQNTAVVARIIALLVLLGSVSPWLLLLPVASAPPLLADRVAKRITRRSKDAMAADRRLAGLLFDLSTSASAAGELRCYGLAPHIRERHAGLEGTLNRRAAAEARKVLAVQSAGWLCYAAGLMAAIAFVVVRATDGAISLGTVLMTVSLIRRSRSQLASAASGSSGMISTLATADRLLWLEDHYADSVAVAGKNQAPARLGSGITVRDLSFVYPGTERTVLSSLSLFLPAGATIAVVGDLPELESEPLAMAALDQAGATDLANQLQSGLSTYVGTAYTGGHNLSGGQWQKLALGRAMRAQVPLLVILDEPTASLDAHADVAHAAVPRRLHPAGAGACSAAEALVAVQGQREEDGGEEQRPADGHDDRVAGDPG